MYLDFYFRLEFRFGLAQEWPPPELFSHTLHSGHKEQCSLTSIVGNCLATVFYIKFHTNLHYQKICTIVAKLSYIFQENVAKKGYFTRTNMFTLFSLFAFLSLHARPFFDTPFHLSEP